MTRVLFVLSTLLVGCRFTGTSEATSDAPPGDDAVDAPPGSPDARSDAPPGTPDAPLDTDGDGHPDGADNCPADPNADQANEDGDDRGDVCDGCPHLTGSVPGADSDGDADGIGDQCDPRLGIDRKVVFLGFNSPDELAMFQSRAGSSSWSISAGQLHQTDPSVTIAQQLVWTGESIDGTVVVDSTVHVEAVPAPSALGTRLAAVAGAYEDGPPADAYACGLRWQDPAAPTRLGAWHYDQPPTVGDFNSAPHGGSLAPGATSRVVLTATDSPTSGSSLDCATPISSVNLVVAAFVPTGFPGFRTLGAQAAYDYLFVVEVGP